MQALCYYVLIEGEQFSNPQEIKKMNMTFSEEMVAKYGKDKWAEMQAKADEIKNQQKVIITGTALLNNSVTTYIMTGNSNSNSI